MAVSRDPFGDRREPLHGLDALRRTSEAGADNFDRLHRQAFDVILRGTAAAFDLSKE